jgi:hypothetical protein
MKKNIEHGRIQTSRGSTKGLIYTMVLKQSAEVDRKPHSLSDVIHVRGSEHFTRFLCRLS